MALRAHATGSGPAPAEAPPADVKLVRRPDADLPTDEVVMLLVTGATFARARALGQAYGATPAEVFARALGALEALLAAAPPPEK